MERAAMFDTHSSFTRLKRAGFTDQQAEAQTDILRDLVDGRLATKRDLQELEARLEGKIKELEVRLVSKIKELEVGLKELEARLKSEIKAEIKVAQLSTVKWVVGIAFAQFAALAALILKLPL